VPILSVISTESRNKAEGHQTKPEEAGKGFGLWFSGQNLMGQENLLVCGG
jgi:hypothetical protein